MNEKYFAMIRLNKQIIFLALQISYLNSANKFNDLMDNMHMQGGSGQWTVNFTGTQHYMNNDRT